MDNTRLENIENTLNRILNGRAVIRFPILHQPTLDRLATFTVSNSLTVHSGTIPITNIFGSQKTIGEVHCRVSTAPTGSALIIDIHKNGTTIFTDQSHRPQIAVGTTTVTTTTIDITTWSDNEYLTMDVDQIGSSVNGAGLTVEVRFK